MEWLEYGILFAVAFAVTVLATPWVRKLAVRFDAVDYPDDRRVNKEPIPRLGGVAICCGILCSLGVMVVCTRFLGWEIPLAPRDMRAWSYLLITAGALVMFGVGVVDDLINLRPIAKFAGQIVAAIIVCCSGLLLDGFHNPFSGEFIAFGIWAYPITVFYLVAFANVINLIDGLDGLAAGITAIAAFTIFVFALMKGEVEAAFLSLALVGSCLGFLIYNFNPASIFMGDSGALLLGFSLGITSLFALFKSTLVVSLLIPILAAGVPILDTSFAIVRRLRAGRSIASADTGHIHHRLMKAGFSQRSTVLIMWGWTAILSVCAVYVTTAQGWSRIVALILVCCLTVVCVWKLKLLGPALSHHYIPRKRRGEEGAGAQPASSDVSEGDGGVAGGVDDISRDAHSAQEAQEAREAQGVQGAQEACETRQALGETSLDIK